MSQGPPGPPGFQGFQGSQGEKGSPGMMGDSGLRGGAGGQGDKGTSGLKGFTGGNGARGFTGPRGPQGYTGMPGPVGKIGDFGFFGISGGPQGNLGDPGDLGVQGDIGYGSIGGKGFTGFQGVQGVIGDAGPLGPPGPPGPRGPPGPPGANVAGPIGNIGHVGIGPRGFPGPAGTNSPNVGSQGSQGRVGSRGHVGVKPTGVQGAQGADNLHVNNYDAPETYADFVEAQEGYRIVTSIIYNGGSYTVKYGFWSCFDGISGYDPMQSGIYPAETTYFLPLGLTPSIGPLPIFGGPPNYTAYLGADAGILSITLESISVYAIRPVDAQYPIGVIDPRFPADGDNPYNLDPPRPGYPSNIRDLYCDWTVSITTDTNFVNIPGMQNDHPIRYEFQYPFNNAATGNGFYEISNMDYAYDEFFSNLPSVCFFSKGTPGTHITTRSFMYSNFTGGSPFTPLSGNIVIEFIINQTNIPSVAGTWEIRGKTHALASSDVIYDLMICF